MERCGRKEQGASNVLPPIYTAGKEIPFRMNPAILLIQILNLQFPFPTTIKI